MKNFRNILITVILATFIFSCNKSKEGDPAAASASLVGKWTFIALGIKTDTKTTEATAAEIKKINPDTSTDLSATGFELKTDGTVISTSEEGVENGKYIYDSSKKTLKITSDTEKDAAGKPEVTLFDVLSVSSTEMVLGAFKSSTKDKDGDFVFVDEAEAFAVYLFAVVVFGTKNIDVDADLDKAKSIQITLRMKK